MFSLELPMNFVLLIVLMTVPYLLGFAFRSRKLSKTRKKLVKLERELMNSHAEILELQKECMDMELALRGIKDPVIVIREISNTERNENRQMAC